MTFGGRLGVGGWRFGSLVRLAWVGLGLGWVEKNPKGPIKIDKNAYNTHDKCNNVGLFMSKSLAT